MAGLRAESLGSGSLQGVLTTKYLLVKPACTSGARPIKPMISVSPTEIWVDDQDRLVQARSLTHFTIAKGALGTSVLAGKSLVGQSTTVSTIRLYDFGAPVSITAPKVLFQPHSSQLRVALRSSSSCPL